MPGVGRKRKHLRSGPDRARNPDFTICFVSRLPRNPRPGEIHLARYIIKGILSVHVLTTKATQEWVDNVRDNGFAVSVIDINQKEGRPDKYMLFLEINKNDFNKLFKLIKKYDKDAFIVINESKSVINGYFYDNKKK